MKLTINLQQFREKAGMSQAQLARESGLSEAMISRIETLERTPSLEVIAILARTLDIPIHKILAQVEE